jgi:hypothetical protein
MNINKFKKLFRKECYSAEWDTEIAEDILRPIWSKSEVKQFSTQIIPDNTIVGIFPERDTMLGTILINNSVSLVETINDVCDSNGSDNYIEVQGDNYLMSGKLDDIDVFIVRSANNTKYGSEYQLIFNYSDIDKLINWITVNIEDFIINLMEYNE